MEKIESTIVINNTKNKKSVISLEFENRKDMHSFERELRQFIYGSNYVKKEEPVITRFWVFMKISELIKNFMNDNTKLREEMRRIILQEEYYYTTTKLDELTSLTYKKYYENYNKST
jgi:hypothetical protein